MAPSAVPAPPSFDVGEMAREHGTFIERLAVDLETEAKRLEAAARAFRNAASALRGERPALQIVGVTTGADAPTPARRQRRPSGSQRVTEEQVRDWIVDNARDRDFRVVEVVRALNGTRSTVGRFIRGFVSKGMLSEVGPQQGRRYRYAPPPHSPLPERRTPPERQAATASVSRGEAVAFTGQARGSSGKPGRDKAVSSSGHRIRKRAAKGHS